MRVVSLLPSATELLAAIPGGTALLVGRSHECDFPPEVADRPVLTSSRINHGSSAEIDQQVREAFGSGNSRSLYRLNEELLESLRPDVILTQDLCDVCSIDLATVRQVACRLSAEPAIVSLNPTTVEDVFDDILRVGDAVGLGPVAQHAMVTLRERYWSARDFVNPYLPGPEVAFLEWIDPIFVAGHWTPQLIEHAGGRHSLNPAGAKSKQVSCDELVASMPEWLIICPCGLDLPMIRSEMQALTGTRWWPMLPAVMEGHVALVDGVQMFNRPGPRLVDALCWLVGWINDRPELVPEGFPASDLESLHSSPTSKR